MYIYLNIFISLIVAASAMLYLKTVSFHPVPIYYSTNERKTNSKQMQKENRAVAEQVKETY